MDDLYQMITSGAVDDLDKILKIVLFYMAFEGFIFLIAKLTDISKGR